MSIEMLRHFFGWCAVINYAMLLLWFLLHMVAHGFFVSISEWFFGVSGEKYDSISIRAMFFFKLSIWLFCIAPYLALRIMA